MLIGWFWALLGTLVIESFVAFVLGYRKKKEIAVVLLANFATNPALNFLLALNSSYGYVLPQIPLLVVLELIVVVAESALLRYGMRRGWKEMVILSLAMNASSFAAGLILSSI
jgi:hypothetical protein